ncbi:hypothetical protein FACS189456_0920 [Bacteroidia bacterium]|nr:hypothetical protein FACS189456_0920 [Bacteroidia bacterium]
MRNTSYVKVALIGAIAGVMVTACNDKEGNGENPNGVPEATVVTGDTANTCPVDSVILTASATDAQTYKWYNGTTLISGATTNTYVVKASGNYSAEGVNTVGTGTKSAGIEVTITSCGTGTDPDTITWTLNSGVLTISGKDTMPNYEGEWVSDDFVTNTPWYTQSGDITSVIIEDGITSIGSSAFWGCSNLTAVTIPNSVTSIGERAFDVCIALTSVTIPNSVTSIGHRAFDDCRALTSVTIPNSVTSIGDGTFAGCRALTSVTIPNSVTSIGSAAFNVCNSLTSITIPNSVTSIGEFAFLCCGLTSVTISNSVTSIEEATFSECRALTSVTIPNSVTSIGEWAFGYCDVLASVTIGSGVTSIGGWAFSGCEALTSVTCLNPTPPTLESDVFSGISSSCTFNVPAGSVSAYEAAGWGSYGTVVAIVP